MFNFEFWRHLNFREAKGMIKTLYLVLGKDRIFTGLTGELIEAPGTRLVAY